jgi:hypothetical protein
VKPKVQVHVVIGQIIQLEDLFTETSPGCDHESPEGAKFCPKCGKRTSTQICPEDFTKELFGEDVTLEDLRTRPTKPDNAQIRVLDVSTCQSEGPLWAMGVYLNCFVPGQTISTLPGPHVKQIITAVTERFQNAGVYKSGKLKPTVSVILAGG